MLTFLFWNCNNKDLAPITGKLVAEHHVDVLVLAECRDPDAIVRAIRTEDKHGDSFSLDPMSQGVRIYTRFHQEGTSYELDERGVSIRRIGTIPDDILLVAVHLTSKSHWSDADQAAQTTAYADLIKKIEEKVGHQRTVLVGDLNMNPFDHGMIQATGFHAVPSHRVAARGERKVDGKYYPLFYNPMWNLFGDERRGPPGTYYYDKSKPITYFWHIFDQVLIRPSLVPRFLHEDLQIISQYGGTGLVDDKGRPNVSDHLPIIFRLDLEPPGVNHGEEANPQARPTAE